MESFFNRPPHEPRAGPAQRAYLTGQWRTVVSTMSTPLFPSPALVIGLLPRLQTLEQPGAGPTPGVPANWPAQKEPTRGAPGTPELRKQEIEPISAPLGSGLVFVPILPVISPDPSKWVHIITPASRPSYSSLRPFPSFGPITFSPSLLPSSPLSSFLQLGQICLVFRTILTRRSLNSSGYSASLFQLISVPSLVLGLPATHQGRETGAFFPVD